MPENYIIGMTGGSAAGKSEFLNRIIEKFNKDQVCLLSQDNYYLPRDKQPVDEKGYINFDRPEAIDANKFSEQLRQLKQGHSIELTEYVFNRPTSAAKRLLIKPAPVIIVEGIFIYYYQEISQMIDLKLYVEAGSHLMLKRRLIRDQEERGYDQDEILYRFEKHVIPAYERYTLPFKKTADLVIPNYERFDVAFDVIASFISDRV